MAAYVKFMEAAGARVVPLILGESETVTLEKISKLDGVLFPGGDGDYIEMGGKIIRKIMEYNDDGHFYQKNTFIRSGELVSVFNR